MTDYLRFIMEGLKAYQPCIPLVRKVLRESNQKKIIDLCSGSGTGMASLARELRVPILLTDKYPNIPAFEKLKCDEALIDFLPASVDATKLDPSLKGLRTMFTAFHHFNTREARNILEDSVRNKVSICIFEGAERSVFAGILMIFVIPLLIIFLGFFIRPFNWNRFLFTYFIPIIPFCTMWDGVASFMKLYKKNEMLAMTQDLKSYNWEVGKLKHPWGFRIVYLTGYPKD